MAPVLEVAEVRSGLAVVRREVSVDLAVVPHVGNGGSGHLVGTESSCVVRRTVDGNVLTVTTTTGSPNEVLAKRREKAGAWEPGMAEWKSACRGRNVRTYKL